MRVVLGRLGRLGLGVVLGFVLLEAGLRGAGYLTKRADRARIASVESGIGDSRPGLLCLGACYTAGIGSAAELSYPAQLERIWGQRHPDAPIRVYNGGLRARGIEYFAEGIDELLETYRPAVVVVNVNDRVLYTLENIEAARRGLSLPLWARDLVGDLRMYRAAHLLFVPSTRRSALEEPTDAPQAGQENPTALSAAAGVRRVRVARKRAQRNPDDPHAWRVLAQDCSDQAELDCVIEANREVLRLLPTEWDAMRRIAVAHALARNYRAAHEAFGETRRLADGGAIVTRLAREAEARLAAEPNHFNGTWSLTLDLLSTYAAVLGDWGAAADHAGRLVREHPGALQANDLLEFYAAARVAQLTREDLPLVAPSARDSLYQKHRNTQGDTERRFGVYGVNGDASGDGEDLLRDVLQINLSRIIDAAERRGVRVVVEDFSAAPEQREVIRTLCDAFDVPLVPLQDAFDAYPDRQSLMHPTLSMRLNAEGNRFLAEQVYTVLNAEDIFDE